MSRVRRTSQISLNFILCTIFCYRRHINFVYDCDERESVHGVRLGAHRPPTTTWMNQTASKKRERKERKGGWNDRRETTLTFVRIDFSVGRDPLSLIVEVAACAVSFRAATLRKTRGERSVDSGPTGGQSFAFAKWCDRSPDRSPCNSDFPRVNRKRVLLH